MDNRIANFRRVSCAQYVKDRSFYASTGSDDTAAYGDEWMRACKLPTRATAGSAGYDFFLPLDHVMVDQNGVIIPTGIRCIIKPGWFLAIMPKSGLAFKYGIRLANTVGVVDEDYANADNEGHILIKLYSDIPCELTQGQKFAQGILLPYGVDFNDAAGGERHGGFGSTGTHS